MKKKESDKELSAVSSNIFFQNRKTLDEQFIREFSEMESQYSTSYAVVLMLNKFIRNYVSQLFFSVIGQASPDGEALQSALRDAVAKVEKITLNDFHSAKDYCNAIFSEIHHLRGSINFALIGSAKPSERSAYPELAQTCSNLELMMGYPELRLRGNMSFDMLLDEQAEDNPLDEPDVKKDKLMLVKMLLESGVRSKGYLSGAAWYHRPNVDTSYEMCKLLSQFGETIKFKISDISADNLNKCIECGLDIKKPTFWLDRKLGAVTLLMAEVARGSLGKEMVRALLEHKVDVNQKNETGLTACQICLEAAEIPSKWHPFIPWDSARYSEYSQKEFEEILKGLIKAGAEPFLPENNFAGFIQYIVSRKSSRWIFPLFMNRLVENKVRLAEELERLYQLDLGSSNITLFEKASGYSLLKNLIGGELPIAIPADALRPFLTSLCLILVKNKNEGKIVKNNELNQNILDQYKDLTSDIMQIIYEEYLNSSEDPVAARNWAALGIAYGVYTIDNIDDGSRASRLMANFILIMHDAKSKDAMGTTLPDLLRSEEYSGEINLQILNIEKYFNDLPAEMAKELAVHIGEFFKKIGISLEEQKGKKT